MGRTLTNNVGHHTHTRNTHTGASYAHPEALGCQSYAHPDHRGVTNKIYTHTQKLWGVNQTHTRITGGSQIKYMQLHPIPQYIQHNKILISILLLTGGVSTSVPRLSGPCLYTAHLTRFHTAPHYLTSCVRIKMHYSGPYLYTYY
jgi:hypothetical protein